MRTGAGIGVQAIGIAGKGRHIIFGVGAEAHIYSVAKNGFGQDGPQGAGSASAKRRLMLIWTAGFVAAAAIAGVVAWRASISAEKP